MDDGAPSRRPPRFPELDGVRGLAMASVLIWHYAAFQTSPGTTAAYVQRLFSLTWAGVDLFFVLSGFLVGGILLDNRDAPHLLKTFYVRRTCRLAPLFYVILALFAATLMSGVLDPRGSAWAAWLVADPMPLWAYATQTQNVLMVDRQSHGANWLAVTWSLAVEVQFFAFVPWLIRLVPPGSIVRALLAIIIGAVLFRSFVHFVFPQSGFAGFLLMPGRLDALCLGVLGAVAVRRLDLRTRLERSLPQLRAAAVCLAAATLLLIATGEGIATATMNVWGHSVIALLGLAIILLAVISEHGRTRRCLRLRWLVWLGTVSYGVFLLHQPMSGLLHGMLRGHTPRIADAPDAAVTLLALACTLTLAAVSERFLERPFIQLGQRFHYHA
jgi:peptidoglycan/LPS O-acetylase OafA/YrhL